MDKNDFNAGMKVKFNPLYESEADKKIDYTLVEYDPEDGTGRVEDKHGEGWYIHHFQIMTVNQDS